MNYSAKLHLIAQEVTLNGRKAVICGAMQPWATVATLDSERRISGEFAWHTAERIVKSGGDFRI